MKYASSIAIGILCFMGISYMLINGIIRVPVKLPEMSFVKRKGSQLLLDDEPFYVNGWNSYWLMSEATHWTGRSKVANIMKEGAAMGLTICRTWAFSDGGYHALQTSPGHYDESVFKALDYVIVEARRQRVRLLLSLVNNLNAFGGKGQYVQWAREAGIDVGYSNDSFFSHPSVMSYYKAHVKAILTRKNSISGILYRDDPAIFGWELINEPRCTYDPSGNILQKWIEEMSLYVKSLDNKHLLTIGMEGFYSSWSPDSLEINPGHWAGFYGSDFIRNHLISSIDFGSVHAYPDEWLPDLKFDAQLKEFENWVKMHVEDGAFRLEKPVLVTEFGLSDRSKLTERHRLLKSMFDIVYESSKSGGAAAGAMVWQLLLEGLDEYRDAYAIIPKDQPSTTKLIATQSCRLQELSQNQTHKTRKCPPI